MSAAAISAATKASLPALFAGIVSAPAIDVSDVTLDSTSVTPGALFIARKGTQRHGLHYAADAIRRGAAVIAYEPGADQYIEEDSACVWLPVPDLGAKLGIVAARFFNAPSRELQLISITGTNGKTTVAWLVANALTELGKRCAYLGTIGSGFPDKLRSQALTTPDVIELSRALRAFVSDGAVACALEASSHALAQDRLAGLEIDCAVFTNLGHDHLDYHGTSANYFAAKASLFSREKLGTRVINLDTQAGRELAADYPDAVLVASTREIKGRAMFAFVSECELTREGIHTVIRSHQGEAELRSPLLGAFNVQNLLSAFGALLALGFESTAVAKALGSVAAPAGRMQVIESPPDAPLVVVDFAHTPEGLQAALQTLKPHVAGQLWVVFGCGGDRDAMKRPEMGAVASRFADVVVITSDNPRSEDPVAITAAIEKGLPASGESLTFVDRREAIAYALRHAGALDCVLIAGRGHEAYQDVNGEKRPFDDRIVARELLAESCR